MRRITRGTRRAISIAALWAAGTAAMLAQQPGSDWPQWRGPNRTGVSAESGLLAAWPPSGPPRVWAAANLGEGYGSVAVTGDRVFVQGLQGNDSVVSSLNRADGRLVWTKALGSGARNSRGSGPRGTPTVDGDRLYVLTETGDLVCLRWADGAVVWRRHILREFGGRNIEWLISESPLVDGDRLFVTPGGRNAAIVALDKMTGRTLWTSRGLSDQAGYASAIVADVQGVRTVMTLTGEAGVGVRASDGKLMWRYRQVANGTANVATPVFHDGRVFYTSGYGTGGALLELTARGGEVTAREVYFTRDMQNHHGGVVVVGGYLYGYNNSILTCLEFATGRMMWRDRAVGKGSLTYADGHLYILGEDHIVGLVEATSAGYREKGRFRIPDAGRPSWAHPVVSGGRLYLRNQGTLTSYDVRTR